MDKAAYLHFLVEIIRRSDDQKGFEVLPDAGSSGGPWTTRRRRLCAITSSASTSLTQ
ncbi:hypothetical protein X769_32685 [Mesorhizobium sp. LSJC268A00]|nr:hypothetical protein X769_32685 [Mesorhizobium sp. LSJC268A00]